MGMEMTKVDGDIVRPDRLKATVTGMVSGISMGIQMISVGKVTYMTNPLTGNWEQLPSQFAVLSVFNPNTGITTIMRGITSLAKLSDAQSAGVMWGRMSIVDTKPFMLPVTRHSIVGHTPPATESPV
jgi:hypothetical protein